jgi:hypothetical protein
LRFLIQTSAAAGVTSADDVQVRCTTSSVSVAVPDRYLLQLSLPFRIRDEAESVKFSSKKQPATLTVTMTVEGSISDQQQQPAPQLSPAAAASANSTRAAIKCSSSRQRQQAHRQQQQQPPAEDPCSSGSSSSAPLQQRLSQVDVRTVFGGIDYSTDRRDWLLPYALAADWLDNSGAGAASDSLLWMLFPYPPPAEGPPGWLVRLTPGKLVLALLGLLLQLIMGVPALVYMLVSAQLHSVARLGM